MPGAKGLTIKSIEDADLKHPRFVWVDEDGKQVSPVHRNMRAALSFISGWQTRYDNLVQAHSDSERSSGRFLDAINSMTKSGKPPVKLKRVKISVEVEDLTEDEQRLVGIMKS